MEPGAVAGIFMPLGSTPSILTGNHWCIRHNTDDLLKASSFPELIRSAIL